MRLRLVVLGQGIEVVEGFHLLMDLVHVEVELLIGCLKPGLKGLHKGSARLGLGLRLLGRNSHSVISIDRPCKLFDGINFARAKVLESCNVFCCSHRRRWGWRILPPSATSGASLLLMLWVTLMLLLLTLMRLLFMRRMMITMLRALVRLMGFSLLIGAITARRVGFTTRTNHIPVIITL